MSKNAMQDDDLQTDLPRLAENLNGNQTLAKQQLVLTRGEAAYFVWRQSILSENKRQEIGRKLSCIPHLLALVGGGDHWSKHSAVGCLQFLATSDDLKELIMSKTYGDKSLHNIVKTLEGDHDRTKVRAAALTYQLCQLPEVCIMMKDYLDIVISLLAPSPHKWAGIEDARAFAAGILRAFAHCDYNPELMAHLPEGTVLRNVLVEMKVVAPLVTLLKTGNQLGQTEAISLLAVLAEEEGVPLELLHLGALPKIVDLLSTGQDEARAHAAGVIFLIAVEPEYMEEVADAGAIPPLVKLLSPPESAGGADGGKGKKGKKKGRKGKKNLPPAVDLAIQNAAGSLRHLSFRDHLVKQIVTNLGIVPLVQLLDSRNVQTFQHATGTLYNIALDVENYEKLVDAKAPKYLTRPLHERWLSDSSKGMGHHFTS